MNSLIQVERIIAKEFNIEPEFRNIKRQLRKYVIPKKVMCSYLYNKEEMTYVEIGKYMGYHDHSTVIHHVNTLDNLCETDEDLCEKVDRVFEQAYKTIYLKQK